MIDNAILHLRSGCLALLLLANVPTSFAEEAFDTGPGTLTTSARLRFALESPSFLYFRIGSADASISSIEFNVTSSSNGGGTRICGSGGLGTAIACPSGSASTVEIQSNAGPITIRESNNSGGQGMGDGFGNFINYSELLVSSLDINFPSPALSNSGGNSVNVAPSSGSNVTQRVSVWEYQYNNSQITAPGTYGTVTNGGRVTYTVSAP